MKNLIIALVLISLISCSDARYRVGDKVCAYGNTLTIYSVHTFNGNGASYGGANYECKYVDKNGIIQKVTIYEKEITPCK